LSARLGRRPENLTTQDRRAASLIVEQHRCGGAVVTKTGAITGATHNSLQWWSVVQAVTWIVGRSLLLVERASSMDTFAALRRLQELKPVSVGNDPPISLAAAPAELMRAAKDGRVGISGRLGRSGRLESVAMHGHLQTPWLADHGNEVRLGNEQMARAGHYWTDLWVRSDECVNRWPRLSQTIGRAGDVAANEVRQATVAAPVPGRRYGGKASQREHDSWFMSYRDTCIASGRSPNSKADEIAGIKALGPRFDRERARASRRRLAPSDWRSTGKRTGKT
jgi:hypothetical protein